MTRPRTIVDEPAPTRFRERGVGGPRTGAAALVLAWAWACGLGCASLGVGLAPLRISELQGDGDPARRASVQLVIEGLELDVLGETRRAQGSYERALQVDPNNPYAYLAMARHDVEIGDSARALGLLERSRSLLELQGADSPRADVHLVGLRGAALYGSGRVSDGLPYLEEARRLAPDVWGDGFLDASELL